MITQKGLTLSLLLSSGFLSLDARSGFTQMIDEMDRIHSMMTHMHEQISNSFKEMEERFHHPSLKGAKEEPILLYHENEEGVMVQIDNLKLPNVSFKATMDEDDNTLRIKTDDGKLTIQARSRMLALSYSREQKHDKTENESQSREYASSYAQSMHSVSGQLLLNNADIEYDPNTSQLTVAIPFKKKAVAQVPVRIKENLDLLDIKE